MNREHRAKERPRRDLESSLGLSLERAPFKELLYLGIKDG